MSLNKSADIRVRSVLFAVWPMRVLLTGQATQKGRARLHTPGNSSLRLHQLKASDVSADA